MVQATIRLPQKTGEKLHWGNHSRTSTAYSIALAAREHKGLLLGHYIGHHGSGRAPGRGPLFSGRQ